MPETTDNIEQGGGPGLFTGNVPLRQALGELRLRLLDLTGRNRLVNFKHTAGKSLQFVHSNIDATFQRLVGDGRVTITPLPEPSRRDWVSRNGRLALPEPKDYAVNVGIDPSYELFRRSGTSLASANSGSQLRTLYFAEDLGKHCRKLEREARLAIEETGANMLYMVLGFLEFPESPDSDKLYRAPLICVPVSIGRTDEGQYSAFHLNYTGEELAENLSLYEKVKRDFGLNLPAYDAEEEASVDAYFDEVGEAIATLPNWRVRRMMTLALLSFTNMLLVRDLDPANWPYEGQTSKLLSHPLVRQVFEGKPTEGDAQYASEYPIDEHPKGDLPLIYDADSSQHSALIDVLDGMNRVIEGPPGTGKSQTITNLIASALRTGKKILFVAEKLAALQVVKSRLAMAGLDPFILELHSNKTNKKRVLDDLAARVNLRSPNTRELPELLERQEQKRRELKAYADLLNTRVGNQLDLTLHQVMWRAELNRLRCGDSAQSVQELEYSAAPRTTPPQLAALVDRLRYLADQLEPIGSYGHEHPMWGFFPTEFKPEDDLPVQRVLREFASKFEALDGTMREVVRFLDDEKVDLGAKSAERLDLALAEAAPGDPERTAFWLLPRLFPATDPNGVKAQGVLRELLERTKAIADVEAEVSKHLLAATPATDELATAAKDILLGLRTLGLAQAPASALTNKRHSFQQASDRASNAVATLRSLAREASMEFTPSEEGIKKIAVVIHAAESAPRDFVHLQHAGLRGGGVVATIARAIEQLQNNQRRHADLSGRLYMDSLPSEGQLVAAILTLRQGDAWYRVFQTSWRASIGLHKRLSRTKSKTTSAERLRELEDVRQLLQDQAAWASDDDLRTAAGPHFKGDKTALDGLLQLSRWVQQTDAALEDAELPIAALDGTNVDRTFLNRLAKHGEALKAATEALSEYESRVRDSFTNALPRVQKALSGGDWTKRLQEAAATINIVSAAETLLAANVRANTPAELGLKAIAASHTLPLLERQLEEHSGGRALFEEAYAGRHTNLDAAQAAHDYAARVTHARLPAGIERILLSPACVENHAFLASRCKSLVVGWKAVGEFATGMSRYGTFEQSRWLNPTDKTTLAYVADLAARTGRAAQNVSGLLPWAQYVGARAEAVTAGLEEFVLRLETGAIAPQRLAHAFLYRFYASVSQAAFSKSATLRQFSGRRHDNVRKDFAELDKEIIGLRGRQVAQECKRLSSPPGGHPGIRVDEKTEMELLKHLMPQQRPRVPVRQMLQRAGKAIQELKPCFMMGPQAVAQFLAPGHLHFDIVVMDEASQLRPEEAIGAIARGSQLVVVGDPKQLPPTSFFTRMSSTDGDDDGLGQLATAEAESILDVCIGHFQPVRTLRWHYRSRHESLIAFSNQHFYRGELVVFPSPFPKGKALGLRYQYVGDGVYENQMNQIEARRVVDAAVDHILHRPNDSLGIVTLNIKQRDLVSELLEERLRTLPEAAEFKERWEADGMGLFIKNLENVQGDERDSIYISTTFGKPKGADVVRQNFGPISREGGWRRLNVLFTRARKSVAVFSSMRPEDIVVDNRTPEGTRALRNYLEYARSGVLPVERETGLPPESDFEVAVMDVLRSRGHEVVPQLGVAGFRIDLAVKHPTHPSGYLAAIECDGASYHTGVSVRDRDRIRQEILESLGWKGRIWRIWSTDWFRNPIAETERLLTFLDALRQQPVPEEYIVLADTAEMETPQATQMAMDEPAQALVFDDENEDLEIEIGDLVTYAAAESPDQSMHVRLTARQTNPDQGLVAEATPLGAILMGATVGETVVLRVPGKPPHSFVIQGIKRSAHETLQ